MILSDGWEQTKWWRVVGPDGTLWAETSSEQDARSRMRDGDTLLALWRCESTEWRPAP